MACKKIKIPLYGPRFVNTQIRKFVWIPYLYLPDFYPYILIPVHRIAFFNVECLVKSIDVG